MQDTTVARERVDIMELVGGFETYAEAAELNLAATADAPATTAPCTSPLYTLSVSVSVTITKQGC
ncbi:MAG TPA: LxmA leader domain family RiPP [Thermomonospora sp.]|nr:LxmA leader domain family RiPP [Thermomonospora sp.]